MKKEEIESQLESLKRTLRGISLLLPDFSKEEKKEQFNNLFKVPTTHNS